MARNTYGQDERLETPFEFRHLLRAGVYLKRYRFKMLVAFVLSAVAAATGLLSPVITQKALDEVIPAGDMKRLFVLAGMLLGVFVVSVTFSTIRSRIMTKVGQDIIFDIRSDLFRHLQELSFQYYDDRPHGKILIRVVNYVNSVSDMLSNGIINVILEVLNMIFIVIFMLATDLKLSLVVLAGVPILMAFMMFIKKHQRQAWQQVSNKSSNLNAYLQENIVGARVTQIFTREEENAKIFDGLSKECQETWLEATKYSNLIWPGIDNVSVCVRAALYMVALLWLGPESVSIGVVVAISSYAARFWQPIMNLGNLFNTFINNIAYLERIFETLDEPVLVKDKEGATKLPPVRGDVSFEDVSFSYEEGKEVLSHVSFHVKAGESVALVGPTGAGKSTIVNLLSRFYNVGGGKICIDGTDISGVTLNSLRSQMGIMMQDSFIFSGTIGENIRYGRLDATQEEIEAAAKTVCADAFIRKMEDGYQTEVKERGSLLSQGQKQLISFARTLLSDPRILILDEATSSIDVQTEQALQQGIDAMLKGRTSFIIAHRLSTIRNCDRIFYIDRGGITESGTHEELMAKKGDYYHLYTAQKEEVQ